MELGYAGMETLLPSELVTVTVTAGHVANLTGKTAGARNRAGNREMSASRRNGSRAGCAAALTAILLIVNACVAHPGAEARGCGEVWTEARWQGGRWQTSRGMSHHSHAQ
jgi:hypothetical protein